MRLASNEIFWPSNKIYQEVGRAKVLSAPLYRVYLNVRNMSQESLWLIILVFYYPDIDVMKLSTIKPRSEVWTAVQLEDSGIGMWHGDGELAFPGISKECCSFVLQRTISHSRRLESSPVINPLKTDEHVMICQTSHNTKSMSIHNTSCWIFFTDNQYLQQESYRTHR